MPCDNYNFDYEPSGTFVDLNKECYTFDAPVDVERNLKDPVTFRAQTYYRTNFVTPNRCCCKDGGCQPEPQPEPGPCPPPEPGPCPPPEPGPCPPPEPRPCPEPVIPDGCFRGVMCNGVSYCTIAEALEDNPCAGEILVGCGTYELPLTLMNDLCIRGQGAPHTFLKTEPGYVIGDDNVSIMNVSFVACDEGAEDQPGLVLEAANFYVKGCEFRYEDRRKTDLLVTSTSSRVSVINTVFTASANYAIVAENFEGLLSLNACMFNNPVVLDVVGSPNCELRAVTCSFIGQVNYDCRSAEFNGCEFMVGMWKKVNVLPKCDTEFVSCLFDNETRTGWEDYSREMEPVVGMRVGCRKTGITYKINNCIVTSGGAADKTVVFLSEGHDNEPGYIFLNGIEQEIDNSNWGQF